MNIPKNARVVATDAASLGPRILSEQYIRHHEAAWGLEKPVVMVEFVEPFGGHEPGEHDGIRDGYSPGRHIYKRAYCSLADWILAGNKAPPVL